MQKLTHQNWVSSCSTHFWKDLRGLAPMIFFNNLNNLKLQNHVEIFRSGNATSNSLILPQETPITLSQNLNPLGSDGETPPTSNVKEPFSLESMSAKIAGATLPSSETDNAASKRSRPILSQKQQPWHQAPFLSRQTIPPHREASFSVSIPVHDQRWAGDFAQKIVLFLQRFNRTLPV